MPRVVIVGAGFGGLYTVRTFNHAALQLTVIDRHNYHLFQPLLYQSSLLIRLLNVATEPRRKFTLNLKSLIHRELGEGLTEKELASLVGVPFRTITNILANKTQDDPAVWEKFAKYFRMDADFLRTGVSPHARTTVELPVKAHHSTAGHIQKFPLLRWDQMGQVATREILPEVLHAEAMIEATDVSGTRTFAVKVQDDSMEPLFSKEEMIFVNPDLEWKHDDYVIAHHRDGDSEAMLLRQVKRIGTQCILHPLNRKYADIPMTSQDAVWGKVVRLRKNL